MGDAQLPIRVVGVLGQSIVQVEPKAAVAPFHDLDMPK